MTLDPDNTAELVASSLEQIDEVCLNFEQQWKLGNGPKVEDHLFEFDGKLRHALLSELILLDLDYRSRGNTTCDKSEYLSRFPHDGPTIEAVFDSQHNADVGDTSKSQHTASNRTIHSERKPPSRVGRYRIFMKMGAGGFGSVYLARDDKLRRDVAIKFPHHHRVPNAVDTDLFLEEARILATLNHPAIVPVYDVGNLDDDSSSCYVVSQFMEGGDLAEYASQNRLSANESARIVARLSEALHYAHGKGLVHRDVKLSNILRDANGDVYIADFGLALRDANVGSGKGFTGTPSSMSPEQARGEAHLVDGRTDVYGLGIVLYELLTGRRPFENKNVSKLLEQILLREPKPPRQIDDGIPKELERICLKALSKQPADRYTTALDMANDLHAWEQAGGAQHVKHSHGHFGKRYLTTFLAVVVLAILAIVFVNSTRKPITDIRSIAVLPFRPLNVEQDEQYLGLGVTDALITKLSNIRQIEVRPTGSIRHLSDSTYEPLAAGRALGVDAVLDGTIQREGERIRATVRLLRVADGKSLWAMTFDDASSDLFEIQDAISEEITRVLALKLSSQERQRLNRRHTEDKTAREAYYRGRYHWNQRTGHDIREAVRFYRQAIEADPLYALAYAGLADAYAIWNLYVGAKLEEAFPMARAAALKALEFDDKLYEAHATLAYVTFNYDWDWELAEIEFLRAIELNPNYATAHQWYAEYLFYMERFDESLREIHRAAELDPLSIIVDAELGSPYLLARDYERARQEYQRSLRIYPESSIALYGLAVCYEQQGKFEQAIACYKKRLADPENDCANCAYVYAISGQEEKAREVLKKKTAAAPHQDAYGIARIYAGLGEPDQAMRWLQMACEKRDERIVMLRVDSKFDRLRSDPRFADLLRRMRLAN